MLRLVLWRSALVCAAILAACSGCRADGVQRFETYVTADYAGSSAALASSTVWSVFGPVDQPGWRLKIDSLASVYGNAHVFSSAFMAANMTTLGDVMAGYQLNWGNIWAKLYAGAAYQAQTQAFWEAGQIVTQKNYWATAAVEGFWQGGSGFWASGNLSWLQFDNTTSFYGRFAYKLMSGEGLNLSVGAETTATIKNAESFDVGRRLNLYNECVREGALLNLRYGSNELTLSGGLAIDRDESTWRSSPTISAGSYATLSYGRKF